MGRARDVAGVFDRAAPTYGSAGPDPFGHFGRRLVSMLGTPPGRSVLDVGCGAGATLVAAAEVAALAVGADLSHDMLRRAGEALAARRRPAALVRADAGRLPFPDGAFDTVTSSFALTYFPAPGRTAAELRRVLQPGGRIGICVSDGWWFQGDPEWDWHDELVHDLGAFLGRRQFSDPAAVADLLTGAAFGVDRAATEHFPLRWESADHWWEDGWSHGWREVLEALSPPARREYRRRSYERLGDGPVQGRLEAVLVTATAK